MNSARLRLWRVVLLLGIGVWTFGAFAQTETIIHTFTGNGDGSGPSNGVLIRDANGNFYGTTRAGGVYGGGTVYELSPAANSGWTEQILYSFSPTNNGGTYPDGGVVFDGKGNLYGTTDFAGPNVGGTLFELTPASNGTWTEKTLYNFPAGSSYESPYGRISFDSAGNIYGLAQGGNGYGVAYELIPGSNGSWSEKILHTFAGKNDGSVVYGNGVTLDSAGNVYGVAADGPHDYGVVFELVHGAKGTSTEKILYAFTGPADGGGPYPDVVFDQAGNLYGTANFGIYKLTPQSNGTWTQKLIYTFKGGADGAYPDSHLIIDQAGNIYGTTSRGGNHRGTVFELSPGANGTWTEKILHRFVTNGVDGVYPGLGGLTFDASGNLFGTTSGGGSSNNGIVFEITP
jgi:uncharacterized repeat protein (TIGR03803 family)